MITVLILGLLGGVDSLQVASAVGLAGLKKERRWRMAASLTFFDVSMTMIGLLVGNKINASFEDTAQWLAPAFIMLLGLYILIRELIEKEKQDYVNTGWILFLLPFLMSIDNLFTGLGLGTAGYPLFPTAVIIGACSGSMCLLGLVIGKKLRGIIPGKIEIISGLYLIGLAIFLIIKK
jgi:putative Mn2+ efflux pump MntP